MAITKLNSLAIPDDTIVEADLSYPLTGFSSTGIDDNATSTAITIDSDENVGIGISSLVNPLQVGVTSNTASKTSGSAFDGGALRLDGGLGAESSEVAILGGANDGLSSAIGFARQSSADWGTQLRFYTHSTAITTTDELTERMRIDASGNALVGTTSVAGFLNSTTETGSISYSDGKIAATASSDAAAYFKRLTDNGAIVQFRNSSASAVGTIGTESSGLYIGTDDAGIFFNHHGGGNLDAIFPYDISTNSFYNGQMNVGGPSNQFGAGYFNYTTVDNGAVYNNFSGASGLSFSGTGTTPCDNTGTLSDGSHDLGRSNARFKDLYLSGDIAHKDAANNARLLYDKSENLLGNQGTNGSFFSIYLGGTAAANRLDDYEEGNWTPSASSGFSGLTVDTVNCRYTKIGNTVHVRGEISNLSGQTAATFVVGGLPFSIATGVESTFAVMYNQINIDTNYTQIVGYAQNNSNKFRLYELGDSMTWSAVIGNQTSSSTILIFAMTYETT